MDWLLYFSIGCFTLAFIGSIMDFIEWLTKPIEESSVGSKPMQRPSPIVKPIEHQTIYHQVKNVVTPPKYELTVSYIQFCREVVKWSSCILLQYGIKSSFPKVVMKYGKGTRTMGTYSSSKNLVTINLNSHDRTTTKNLLESIASTCLHEVFHFKQSKTDPDYKALTNYKRYGYWSNRIEVEARAFEAKYYKQCIEDMVAKGIIRKVK
jgi:hypothetical protein